MTTLRELAELRECLAKAVNTVNGPLLTDKNNEQAGWAAVSFLQSHGAQLLAILDAEGDSGAVATVGMFRGSDHTRDDYHGKAYGVGFSREGAMRLEDLPLGTKLYTRPARSGVVRDEDVSGAKGAFFENGDYDLGHGGWIGDKAIRAALEHFAKGERHE